MSKPMYSAGGIVGGPGRISVKRLPDCPNGHALFSIGGGPREHVLNAAEARARNYEQILCQRELEGR